MPIPHNVVIRVIWVNTCESLELYVAHSKGSIDIYVVLASCASMLWTLKRPNFHLLDFTLDKAILPFQKDRSSL